MRDLNSIVVFVRVADHRSFTEAARVLGLTASAVSKAITRLETELEVRLLNRTTRSVTLTADGAAFLERCRTILGELDEAESALGQVRTAPRGRLRVQMPVGFGSKVVMPALSAFAARHPDLIVDAELSDRNPDLAYEALDAAIVIGDVVDPRVVARPLCDLHFIPVASPAYLKKHGRPRVPEDLEQHHCLAYVVPQIGRYREWQFVRDGVEFSRPLSGRVNVNNAESLLEAAIAGVGVAMLSTFITADAVRRGELEFLLADYATRGPRVSLVYLPGRHASARMRAFVEFMTALLPTDLPWDRATRAGSPRRPRASPTSRSRSR